ncbi:MAG TPA: S26 family signal peptidase, partial [Gemmataceae bacterium]|nr:S26 family signal peptidase [Gemmataceae bacterium]
IGLPGETIAIHDGDLYVLAADKGLRYPGDLDIAKQTTGSGMDPARRLWEKRFLHTNDEEALKRFANHEFVIIRKPPETLLTMRRIVYDNDHPAKDLADFHQPPRWADLGKGTGWASDGKNGFRLEAANAGAERRLSYRHLLRDERMEWRARKAKLKSLVQKDAALRAHLNQLKDPMKEILTRRKPPDLTPQQEREWQQQLDRAADPIALLDDGLSADVQKLLRDFADNRNGFTADSVNRSFLELIAPELPPREAVLDELRQAYAQEQPQLITDFMGYNTGEPEHGASGVNWVGDLILECDVQHDQAQGELTLELSKGVDRFQAHFDLASGQCNLFRVGQDKPLNDQPKPTALKGGGKHSVRFANVDQRLTVWVDDALPFGDGVPYDPPKTEGPTKENDLDPANIGMKGVGGTVSGLRLWRDTYYTIARNGDPTVPDAGSGVDFADPTWDKLRDLPTRTMYVQPGNYLCLGDNSPRSSDGRFWGLVPERLLLGKAVVIFYPIDRIARIK